MLIGAVLAGTTAALIWYLVMHRFALRGEWLGSGLTLALASALGMLVGVWSSDRRQKSGWVAAFLAGTTVLLAILGSTEAAMSGTPVINDGLTSMAKMAPLLAFMGAFTVALSSSPTLRRSAGWAAILGFCLIPLALAFLVYLRLPADQARSSAIADGTLLVGPDATTTTTLLPHMDPKNVTACLAEKAAVERTVNAANATTGMTPTDIDPSLANHQYRTWGQMADGRYIGGFKSPWVC